MTRRKNNNEQGVNMDSLMDALTNVVAVLIVILILLQCDVQNQVEKILNDLKPASTEEIAAAQLQKENLITQIKNQTQLLDAPEPTPEDFSKIEADIMFLDRSLKNHDNQLLELAKLRKKVEEQKALVAVEKKKTDTILAEIARIKALLDQTPIPKAPTATVVRFPNSRPIPESAEIFYCFIINDQAHLVDAPAAKKMVMKEMKDHERELIRSINKFPKKPDEKIFDQEKTVAHFAQCNLKIRHYNVTVPYNKPWPILNMRITFDPKKGDASLADMEQPKGRFHNICHYVRSIPRSVMIFKVNTNGFATYLKAREIADSMNIPCGWEIDSNSFYQERLDFKVNNLEQPPKPTGPSKPGLTRKLD